ncbi:MAG: DUF2029 domain-containing protein [Anaerolineaceae bacterium]|nr:DUF2029 domain-containing protein [Anaerolineaceae bacterium]
MTRKIITRMAFPAILIAMILVTSFGVITISYVLSKKPLVFLNYLPISGWDYKDFFVASERILTGLSPYNFETNRYVTTPIPAIFNIPFVLLGFDLAKIVLFIFIPCSIISAYFIIVSTYKFPTVEKEPILLAGLSCILFGYPFYFLIQRVNIDGWVLLFLSLGLFFFHKPKKEWLSGLFFSLAVAFKIYPILIFIPLLLNRKWKSMVWIVVWGALWVLISCFWLADMQTMLVSRSQSLFRWDENGSLLNTTIMLIASIKLINTSIISANIVSAATTIAAVIYSILISTLIIIDYKLAKRTTIQPETLILYVPFMIGVPQLVFHYSFIILLLLIPAICYLWGKSKNKWEKIALLAMTIGVALTQFQAIAAAFLTKNILAHGIPGFGLLIIMISIVSYKKNQLRSSTALKVPVE